ncbi:hypothetical protein [Paraburkholderia dilworthii]|uniref:Uncharacterized protein n=1 Tax=Paraburkholderia dilworthii TaxID=948106 RepID=A0ABW9DDJ3_9BURK
MYSWPDHFPEQCPPSHATDLSGSTFRFINKRQPTEYDFTSHYERLPGGDWAGQECKARGLSVLRTYDDCVTMREGVPALRRKHLAVANVAAPVGVVATTPSANCVGHCTWWRNVSPAEAAKHFSLLTESNEEDHV